jgi:predicted Zn-dependent protease with MMP-like domain
LAVRGSINEDLRREDRPVIEMTRQRFEELVAEALDGIPEDLGKQMENVSVMVDPYAPAGRLFGLYEGVPLIRRGIGYSAVLPDRITIFMRSICMVCRTEEEVTAAVRRTVIHEVAHHFGIDDGRLGELGWG